MNDYSSALSTAEAFDTKLQTDASAISSDYADVVALSVRQAFGAMEITVSSDGDNSWNSSDVLVFLKGEVPKIRMSGTNIF
jgi:hypothetical protein